MFGNFFKLFKNYENSSLEEIEDSLIVIKKLMANLNSMHANIRETRRNKIKENVDNEFNVGQHFYFRRNKAGRPERVYFSEYYIHERYDGSSEIRYSFQVVNLVRGNIGKSNNYLLTLMLEKDCKNDKFYGFSNNECHLEDLEKLEKHIFHVNSKNENAINILKNKFNNKIYEAVESFYFVYCGDKSVIENILKENNCQYSLKEEKIIYG